MLAEFTVMDIVVPSPADMFMDKAFAYSSALAIITMEATNFMRRKHTAEYSHGSRRAGVCWMV
jgi:hypothetical protein